MAQKVPECTDGRGCKYLPKGGRTGHKCDAPRPEYQLYTYHVEFGLACYGCTSYEQKPLESTLKERVFYTFFRKYEYEVANIYSKVLIQTTKHLLRDIVDYSRKDIQGDISGRDIIRPNEEIYKELDIEE